MSKSLASQIAITVGLVLAGLAGYSGFLTVTGSGRAAAAGTVALAATTGFAAFFSPCSFPLLLTLLSRSAESSPRASLAHAARIGAGATILLAVLGAVFVLVGTGVATLLSFDSDAGRGFRSVIGALLVVMGLRHAGALRVRFAAFERLASWAGHTLRPSAQDTKRSDVLYGFGYLLAGFG